MCLSTGHIFVENSPVSLDELSAMSSTEVFDVLPKTLLIEVLKIPDGKKREVVKAVGEGFILSPLERSAPLTRQAPPNDLAVPGAQVKQHRVEQVAVCFLALQVHVRISSWRL